MANAKTPSRPSPKDKGREVHGNKAPFTPQKLESVAPGGMHSKKGQTNEVLGSATHSEMGTGKAQPFWP